MEDLVIGSIIWIDAGVQAPEGTIEAAGELLTLTCTDFQALYSIIEARYGGQPGHYFRIPDLRPKRADGTPDPNWNNGPRAFMVYWGTYPNHDVQAELIKIIDDSIAKSTK